MASSSLVSLANRLGYVSVDKLKESFNDVTDANISVGLKSVLLSYGFSTVASLKEELGISNAVKVEEVVEIVEEKPKATKKSKSKKVVEEVAEPVVEDSITEEAPIEE